MSKLVQHICRHCQEKILGALVGIALILAVGTWSIYQQSVNRLQSVREENIQRQADEDFTGTRHKHPRIRIGHVSANATINEDPTDKKTSQQQINIRPQNIHDGSMYTVVRNPSGIVPISTSNANDDDQ